MPTAESEVDLDCQARARSARRRHPPQHIATIQGLSAADREKIKLYLNVDMVASPNGDEERKTAAQANAWGGQAREHYDPCYHEACDRIDNVNREVLNHYMRALARHARPLRDIHGRTALTRGFGEQVSPLS